jgi:hypothetical protein
MWKTRFGRELFLNVLLQQTLHLQSTNTMNYALCDSPLLISSPFLPNILNAPSEHSTKH